MYLVSGHCHLRIYPTEPPNLVLWYAYLYSGHCHLRIYKAESPNHSARLYVHTLVVNSVICASARLSHPTIVLGYTYPASGHCHLRIY